MPLVAKVTDSWPVCHEFESSAAEREKTHHVRERCPLNRSRAQTSSHWCAALTSETDALWRKISLLKKPPQNIPPDIPESDLQCSKSLSEKAEVIADRLQKQFELNTEADNERFTAHTQRKIKRFLDALTCLDLEKAKPGKVQE
ncbi:hypothetical protein TNCV_2905121 [Trichonephila clavipes]|nr:hypothetical protein TNCV_2905121 [Trichonephila clavipes]